MPDPRQRDGACLSRGPTLCFTRGVVMENRSRRHPVGRAARGHLAAALMTVGVLGGLLPVSAWAAPARSTVPSPNTTTQQGLLDGVSCTSAKACTAVGSYNNEALAEAWNGTKWTIEHTPDPYQAKDSTLSGVSCTSAKTCTAAGEYLDAARTIETLAEAWNGKKWTIEHTPNPTGSPDSILDGVSCTSARACTCLLYTSRCV